VIFAFKTRCAFGGEDLKLKGHRLEPFLKVKIPPLHPCKEQQEFEIVNKMKINVLKVKHCDFHKQIKN
jgi:hypothetical protein